ncbi:hypothetical protein BJV77DRAFT_164069 [Russula vinacea]|nr:hypothetical protein BJV77DRAFT_164069 [Russula vinacea]
MDHSSTSSVGTWELPFPTCITRVVLVMSCFPRFLTESADVWSQNAWDLPPCPILAPPRTQPPPAHKPEPKPKHRTEIPTPNSPPRTKEKENLYCGNGRELFQTLPGVGLL